MSYTYEHASTSALETNKVLRNTYVLLGLTLGLSGVAAMLSMALGLSPVVALGAMIGAFVTLFVVNKKADKASGLPWVFAFCTLMGLSLGPMISSYLSLPNGPSLIAQALIGTSVIFFSLSAYALTTKKDFSFMGGFLMVGLIVVLLAMLGNLFFQIPAVSLAISSAVILIMSGLILFDTSRIIHGGETNYIRATVALYLNIFNIFVHLLSLLGIFSND